MTNATRKTILDTMIDEFIALGIDDNAPTRTIAPPVKFRDPRPRRSTFDYEGAILAADEADSSWWD